MFITERDKLTGADLTKMDQIAVALGFGDDGEVSRASNVNHAEFNQDENKVESSGDGK